MLATMVTGCGKIAAEESSAVTNAAVISDTGPSTESSVFETSETTEARKLYSFKTKVSSSFLEKTFGKAMCESWFSLVDAVLAGEDTFSCPNGHTYMWVIAEFPKVIAYDQGRPIGVISYKEEGPGKYYIGCLAVLKEEQGRGVGTQLLKHFMSEHPDWNEITLVTPKASIPQPACRGTRAATGRWRTR